MAEDERYSQYDSPNGEQEIVYDEGSPLDKAKEYAQQAKEYAKQAAEIAGGAAAGAAGAAGGAAGAAGGYAPAVKTGIKRIIIGVIVLAIIAGALWFFVLSNKEFTVSLSDTEGTPLAGSIKIIPENSSTAIFSGNGKASYSFTTKPGNYTVEVNAGDAYKKTSTPMTFSDSAAGNSIKIEKNMNLDIDLAFPEELYRGQETTATATITNKGDESASANLVFEGDLKTLGTITVEPETIVVPTGQSVVATINISVPEDYKLTDSKNGDTKKGFVRIKFLNKKSSETVFKVYPKPLLVSTPTKISLTVTAGTKASKEIKVENKGTFPVKNISFTVDTIDTEDRIKDWFSFQPDATIGLLEEKGIGKKTSDTRVLWLNVPLGAQPETLAPNIIVSTAGFSQTITMTLIIKAAKLGFVAVPSKTTINIPKSDSGIGYEEIITEYISLKNSGIVAIENVSLAVSTVGCRDNWIKFEQGNTKDNIAAGKTEKISMTITATPAAPIGQQMPCQITVTYDDPANPGEKLKIPISLFLVPTD